MAYEPLANTTTPWRAKHHGNCTQVQYQSDTGSSASCAHKAGEQTGKLKSYHEGTITSWEIWHRRVMHGPVLLCNS